MEQEEQELKKRQVDHVRWHRRPEGCCEEPHGKRNWDRELDTRVEVRCNPHRQHEELDGNRCFETQPLDNRGGDHA